MPDGISVDWKNAMVPLLPRAAEELSKFFSDPISSVPKQPAKLVGAAPGENSRIFHIAPAADALERALFQNCAELKMLTAQVAMHLSARERSALFSAVDDLLSKDHWEDESSLINIEAFRTYLRFTIFAHPHRQPNLGVSPDGFPLAGWHAEDLSIYVDFLPQDQCRVVVKMRSDRGPETAAWQGHVARLRAFIEKNDATRGID